MLPALAVVKSDADEASICLGLLSYYPESSMHQEVIIALN